jgi:hypothetical protein
MSRWFKNPQTAIWQILTAVVVVLGLGGAIVLGIFIATSNADLRSQLSDARRDTRAQTANADKLYKQVQELGAKPNAQKPSAVEGKPGQQGDTGPKGDTGDTGTSVTSVQCSPAGVWAVFYSNGSEQDVPGPCVGATGATGPAGADSTVPGPPGADSTVPGPPGPPGADSTVPGPPGADGKPPASWTFVTTNMVGKPTTHTCVPTSPFDPTAPTYTCD